MWKNTVFEVMYLSVLISIKVNKMHIIDVGMQYYTHIARFTAVTLRTLTEINEN
jgi:hypothetical protein